MARKNISVSEDCGKEIAAYAKAKGIEPGEAVDALIQTGAKRLKALSKYNRTHATAKAPKSKKPAAAKKTAAKTPKKAAAKKVAKTAGKAAGKKASAKKPASKRAPKSSKVLNGSATKGAGLPSLGGQPAEAQASN